MKFCQPHWDKLRKAIEECGLSHLIAKDGKEAAAKMVRQIEGTDVKNDYEPLLSAHWMICGNAINVFGYEIMFGETCPLCYLDAHQVGAPPDNKSDDWIKCAADAELKFAKQQGLQG